MSSPYRPSPFTSHPTVVMAEDKFADVLEKGVGLTIIAIAPRATRFPTLRIPDAGDLRGYVEMAAGWNVLRVRDDLQGIPRTLVLTRNRYA